MQNVTKGKSKEHIYKELYIFYNQITKTSRTRLPLTEEKLGAIHASTYSLKYQVSG